MTRKKLRNHYARIMKAFELTPDREIYQSSKMVIDLLNETEWIPVTEKLPEDGQSVLFCDIDDDIMIGYHVKGRHATHFSQDGTYEDMKNVRAWQPLPEPYKGGE